MTLKSTIKFYSSGSQLASDLDSDIHSSFLSNDVVSLQEYKRFLQHRERHFGSQKPRSESIKRGWWIEILTVRPFCLYYFGPFKQWLDADLAKSGYIKDLRMEDSKIAACHIKRCRPRQLTLDASEFKQSDFEFLPSLGCAFFSDDIEPLL